MTDPMKGAPNRANVFGRGITPPGHSEENEAVTTACRLQLWSVLAQISGVPGNFFQVGGLRQEFFSGGIQQIRLRIEGRENGDLGAVAP
jgi:hypothetical protein